jgi:hypothetical protein
MQLGTATDQVITQLSAAAALGDERTRDIASTLAAAAAPAVRLAILGAVSQIADEITAALLDAPGTPVVVTRLDGDSADSVVVDVRFAEAEPAADASAGQREDGEPTARISLRLSEALKADVDAAAARDGVSVNTWLVRSASAALNPHPFAGFARNFADFDTDAGRPGRPHRQRPGHSQRITGWVNG